MSFVLTYNTLVAQVLNDLERMDEVTTEDMDRWIKFAHQRIARDSNSLLFEVYVTQNFALNVPVIQKPNRWQDTITFNYGTGTNNNVRNQLLLRTYEFCRLYWPDDSQLAPPLYYCDYGYNNWLIVPTPDQAYPFEIGYLETPQVIDADFQTNYLTEFMPEVLLKAVMYEAVLSLKNDERIPVFQAMYQEVLQSWNSKDELIKTDRYTDRGAD